MPVDRCMFCLESPTSASERDEVHHIVCPRCGKYSIDDDVYEDHKDALNDRQRANISGWLFDNQDYLIYPANFSKLLTIRTPGFYVRADRLLLTIEGETDYLGQYIFPKTHWMTAGWCVDEQEMKEILGYLLEAGMIKPEYAGDESAYKITPRGWEHIEEISRVNSDSQQGFVAMWFDPGMQTVFDSAISPGIIAAGYRPHLVNMREHNEKIDDEIIAQIRRSRFVLADFTGHRGGVYFEAGFGRGLGLEVFWTCRDDEMEKLHFDIRQYNCIPWEVDKLPEFKNRISNRIESVLGKGTYSV